MIDLTLRQLLVRTNDTQKITLVIHDGDTLRVTLIDASCEALISNLISRTLEGMITMVYANEDVMHINVQIPKTPWLEDEEKDEEDEDE
jgi:hypothetical protein